MENPTEYPNVDLVAYKVHYFTDHKTGVIEKLAFVGASRVVTDPKLQMHMFRKFGNRDVDFSIQSWLPAPKGSGIETNAVLIPDTHWTLQPLAAKELINHPAHYNQSPIEVIDAIEAWGLNFSLGSVVKYIARAKHKGRELEDLKKARWYVNREIERLESLDTWLEEQEKQEQK